MCQTQVQKGVHLLCYITKGFQSSLLSSRSIQTHEGFAAAFSPQSKLYGTFSRSAAVSTAHTPLPRMPQLLLKFTLPQG